MLVVVLAVMVIGLAVALAALASALDSRSHASRDTRVRRAQQAADAGIQATLYQMRQQDLGSTSYNFNGGLLGLSSLLDCIVPQVSLSAGGTLQASGAYGTTGASVGVTANSAGICPQAVLGNGTATAFAPQLANHTSYQAEAIPGATQFVNSAMLEQLPKIVSIGKETSGTAAGASPVYARELAILAPVAPLQTVEGENNVIVDGLTALGLSTAVTVNGNILAHNNLTVPLLSVVGNLVNPLTSTSLLGTFAFGNQCIVGSNSSTDHCPGLAVANVHQVPPSQIVARAPLSIYATSCPACSALAPYYSNKEFSMTSGSFTIPPGDYLLCNFSVTGTASVSANPSATQPVRIYIAAPNGPYCSGNGYTKSGTGGYNGGPQYNGGNFVANHGISNLLTGSLSGATAPLAASGVQIYVQGDQSTSASPPYDDATKVQISVQPTCSGLCLTATAPPTQAFVVYAPTSSVKVTTGGCLVTLAGVCTVGGAGVFEGVLIGNDTEIMATVITQDLDIGNYALYSGVNAYRVTQYVECDTTINTLAAGASDTNGC